MKPVKGMVLCTKNSQTLTNAVVVSVKEGVVEVLSDFGNWVSLHETEIWQYYEVSESWSDHQMFLEQSGKNANETLEDRIKQQINNLQEALETVEKNL